MPDLATLPPNALAVIPRIITEQQLSPFKFYLDYALQDGMAYGNELYRLVKRFSLVDRLEAYPLGCELIGKGIPTVISISKQHYSVWVSLRNFSAAASATP